jgi:hypothetical protein
MTTLTPGTSVTLLCKGSEGPQSYLDGRTTNGTVGLAPNTNPPYTGTVWAVEDGGGGTVMLKCKGVLDGPRYLDRRTSDGSTVGLAENRWIVEDGSDNSTIFLRAAGVPAGNPRYLDGKTVDQTVGLASDHDGHSGTRWKPTIVSS